MSDDTLTESCPLCGALPCDWCNDPRWKDIATAPDDGEFLAGYLWRGKWLSQACKKRARPSGLKLIEARSGWAFPATHWMPLPSGPQSTFLPGVKAA